ncbi:uncharacterized protein LOC123309488 [Coccinella septempunctata]|uniref:uncharacterized protein LOC123309488 n=1 Tax=Coccinella septempunctata TaxID=41139 RepID=UPI001D08FC57|nr:uncharacterized protein LOC123309488 [Coccinella septempunctata]
MKLQGFTILMLVKLLSAETFGTAENKQQKRGIFGFGFSGLNLSGYGSKPSGISMSTQSNYGNNHHVQSGVKDTMEIPAHTENMVHVPYPVKVHVPVDRPYPVHVPKPYPVPIVKHVPYPVVKRIPYPVKVPIKVPIKIPVPIIVPKPYPVTIVKKVTVPVKVPYIVEKQVPVSNKNHRGFGTNGGSHRQGGWL